MPIGRYIIKAITLKIFQTTVFSLLCFESEIILDEKGVNKNFECCINPKPIGAPITVITKKPPVKKVIKAIINPNKGKCQSKFPSFLILFFFFNIQKK